MWKKLTPVFLMVVLLIAACSDNGDNPAAPDSGGDDDGMGSGDSVSFASDVRPILTANCAVASCHGTGFSQNGMTMGAATYNEIMTASGTGSGGLIVEPGNSAQSSLYTKTTASPPFGVRMPAGRTPLTTTEQQTIADWIDQGALDN